MKTKILVYLIIQLFVFVVCDEWGYGPKDGDWDDLDGAECDGKYQSPIDLIDVCNDTDGVVSVDSSLKIEFNNYDKPINAKDILFENNGHTAMITIKGSDEVGKNLPSISGSAVGKNETFQLQQIHFHWNR
jgi:carbonic anhydrase